MKIKPMNSTIKMNKRKEKWRGRKMEVKMKFKTVCSICFQEFFHKWPICYFPPMVVSIQLLYFLTLVYTPETHVKF